MLDEKQTHFLDVRGLTCPEPVMLLHGAVRDADPGDGIVVLATDPSTQRDIPKFCTFLGHELVAHTYENGEYRYEIIRGAAG